MGLTGHGSSTAALRQLSGARGEDEEGEGKGDHGQRGRTGKDVGVSVARRGARGPSGVASVASARQRLATELLRALGKKTPRRGVGWADFS